jgi:hypothetical protein
MPDKSGFPDPHASEHIPGYCSIVLDTFSFPASACTRKSLIEENERLDVLLLLDILRRGSSPKKVSQIEN